MTGPAASQAAAISARGLTKRFETTTALDDVALSLDPGEVRGLLGPNGAGKTTLLRLLFGLLAPDAGTIELFGHDPAANAPDALDGVAGFVESPTFYPYLSGRTNLELLAELDRGSAAQRIDEALERVGLGDRAAERVGGYSTGMLQRLGLAAALLRQPRLLLLDEPTAGLDPAGVREVRELLGALGASGVAVLLSSHQIDEVEEVCESFTVLRRGVVVWDGTAAQLRAAAPPSAYRLLSSDDTQSRELLAHHPDVRADEDQPSEGLIISAEEPALERYVLELARRGVAVRRLELVTGALEAMYFKLTEEPRAGAVAGAR